MSTFEAIREVTSYTRPGGNHGCKLVEIVPGLYTSHFNDIKDKDAFEKLQLKPEIGLVVNSAVQYNQCPSYNGYYGDSIEVLELDMLDDPKPDEPHKAASNATPYIHKAVAAIERTIESGKSAHVHCFGSISRSVALIIPYVMKSKGLSAVEATKLVKSKWDATWPNDTFVRNIIEYEEFLATGGRK